jgi:hypothetical protein
MFYPLKIFPLPCTSANSWPVLAGEGKRLYHNNMKIISPNYLAAYLGHVNVSGTQIYLTMTPELLAEASWRFERYAAVGKEHTHG